MLVSAVQQSESYVPSFLDLLPIKVGTEHRGEGPVPYSSCSLVICFIHGSVCISVSATQFHCCRKEAGKAAIDKA